MVECKNLFLQGDIMKKGFLLFRIMLSSLAVALGVLPAAAQEDEPAVERDTVLMSPLYFVVDDAVVTDENENQRLWNELMKYKLWGTDSVIFNKGDFRIAETSGYTGTALEKVYFRNGKHTLGGPIVSGGDIEISYPGMGAENDTLLKGPVRAGWLVLPNWYSYTNVKYEGTYCFEHQIYFETPSRSDDLLNSAKIANTFIENVHKSGGKVYADWDKDTDGFPGLSGLNLDGSFADCPSDVPTPEKGLSVPKLDLTGITWEPAVDMTIPYEETQFIQVPPITAADLSQSPKHVWFDKYVEDIKVSSHTGKELYVLMPSKTQNANGKTGRLTRVFSRDGFHFDNSANDMKIKVAYVNDEATWNDETNSWDNVDVSKITVVADTDYAGNLLFYTTADVEWKPFKASGGDAGVGADFQGTFMTSGSFKIYDHLSIAGQLIAGEWLWFESEFKGEFHYVPFNSPEIKPDIFLNKEFIENNEKWYDMDFYLTDTARVEVSFDYCFAFFGIDVDTTDGAYSEYKSEKGNFAEPADLGLDDDSYKMPLCKDGETGHVIIKKGSRKPSSQSTAHLKVLEDGLVESDEYMLFRITNLSGAVITGNQFDGDFLIRLIDYDNNAPYFVNPSQKLSVPENETKAVVGTIKAKDNEGDTFKYAITGGTGKSLFNINATSGVVSMKKTVDAFDYEAWMDAGGKVYTITVEVCDIKATSFDEKLCSKNTFKINVTDVNEKPYFTYTDSDKKELRIAENKTVAMDTAKFTDTDRFNTNTLFTNNEVIAIGGDTAVFDVTKDGVVFTKNGVVLDYETKNTYEITLKVRDATTDSKGNLVYPDLYDEMAFTIVVVDVDDGPKFTYDVYNGSIDELIVGEKPVDMDYPILATTTQAGAEITYSLEDPAEMFTIDPVTGVISLAKDSVLDYEVKNTYTVKVIASDATGDPAQKVQSDTADVIIRVNDINELPIIIHTYPDPVVLENMEVGTVVDTVKWNDLDTAIKFRNDIFAAVGGDVTYFEITPDGIILTRQMFDYEMKEFLNKDTTYKLIISLSDKDDPTLVAFDTVTIHIKNVNENPVITTTTVEVKENSKEGTEVDKIKASDVDFDDPDSVLIFTLIEDRSGCFDVAANGVITVKSCKELDYEKNKLLNITVKVEDSNGGSSTKTIQVNIIDIPSPSIEITKAVNTDTTWVKPDTVYTNIRDLDIYCSLNNASEEHCLDTILKPGKNIIVKRICDIAGFEGCAADSVTVFFSDAAPIVKVSANPDENKATNIYTIVEKTDPDDENIYVNRTKNEVYVKVKDPASGRDSSFKVTLNLDTLSIPKSTYDNMASVVKSSIALDINPSEGVTRTPVNGTEVKVSYTKKVYGVPVEVSYMTDNDGEIIKRAVVNDKGKVDSIEVITVSYETVINGKVVTISYEADAVTGAKLVKDPSGKLMTETAASKLKTTPASYSVTYDYKDATGNYVVVTYSVDENGTLVKNAEGDIAYKVSYTYVNKYGNSATQSVSIVLDRTLPKVQILSPEKGEVIRSNFVEVKWTVNGVEQDSLTLQGLEKGQNTIVRFYRDKAGNEAYDSVTVFMKDGKDVDISVEQPVTVVTRDMVEEYYAENKPKDGQTFAVSILNPETGKEVETLIGGTFETTSGSGEEPYPNVEGPSHLGPTLVMDVKVPVVSGVSGLATLDDLISSDGRISSAGVDVDEEAAKEAGLEYQKYTVEEYVANFCEEDVVVGSDYSRVNLYDSELKVQIWVYTTLGNFVGYQSFTQELNNPDYANKVGMLQLFYEMKPDKDGYVRAENEKMLATGAYLYKVDATIKNHLRCSIPPFDGASPKKKGDMTKSNDNLLKGFGYKRPEK